MKRSKPLRRSPIKRKRKTVPKEIRDHWGRVSALGCVICGQAQATIHHVHGGSIRDYFGAKGMPGMGQKQNDWLVIPLAPQYHTGNQGIDNGFGEYKSVVEWEVRFGRQSDFLEAVREEIRARYGYDIYERAGGSFLANKSAPERGGQEWGVDLAAGPDVTVVSVEQSVLEERGNAR